MPDGSATRLATAAAGLLAEETGERPSGMGGKKRNGQIEAS